ncbi:MAG TPA: hypothetical protein VNB54_14590 [Alphaproteobacteria bacterium]|nr:hypothetical protein [Alphaproteobacteria bacterium]
MHRDVSMLHTVLVKIVAHDHADSFNTVAVSPTRRRENRSENSAVLVKESVAVASRVPDGSLEPA